MDSSDSWNSRFSSSSRRYISRSDLYYGGGHDEIDVDDQFKAEFLCPFCAEDFDVVGLCCHFDEVHPVELTNGVCPVCAKRVGLDLVAHLTMQHGSLLKVQRKRRYRRGSTFSMLKKELRDGNLQSHLSGSFMPSSTEPDPLLSSFIYNAPAADHPELVESHSSVKAGLAKDEILNSNTLERNIEQPKLSDKDQEERAWKCEFVQGLLLSTFLDDGL